MGFELSLNVVSSTGFDESSPIGFVELSTDGLLESFFAFEAILAGIGNIGYLRLNMSTIDARA